MPTQASHGGQPAMVAQTRPWPATSPPSLLIAIVDLHPLAWSLLANLQPPVSESSGAEKEKEKAPVSPITLDEFVTILMVFLNAHLASRWGNEVVVYGATAGKAMRLYPPSDDQGSSSKLNPNFYRPFQLLDSGFEERLKEAVREEDRRLAAVEGKTPVNDYPALVSALTKALCHIHKQQPPEVHTTSLSGNDGQALQSGPEVLESRIIILNATPGGAEDASATQSKSAKASGGGSGQRGYVGLMNCVFAAQKAKIPVDVLTLPPESTMTSPPIFLQQAAYLTGGIYWRWNGRGGLLQYLHSIYLPPPSLRRQPFTVPPQDAVDFRAVCFCHNDVVDVGFVCSVCLSIFCEARPICQMCKTKFPIKALPTLKALAADIEPIPIPQTVAPPIQTQRRQPAANGAPSVAVKQEPVEQDIIVID